VLIVILVIYADPLFVALAIDVELMPLTLAEPLVVAALVVVEPMAHVMPQHPVYLNRMEGKKDAKN
jgi:hypothetical protein